MPIDAYITNLSQMENVLFRTRDLEGGLPRKSSVLIFGDLYSH